MIKAVVFDLDDTLYPERDYVKSGFNAVGNYIESKYDLTGIREELLALFDANKADVYGRILLAHCLPASESAILIEIYRTHKPDKLELFPDAMPIIEYLKAQGIKIGIITDGRVDGQRNKVEALGIADLFDNIIYTDSLGGEQYRKPHRASYEQMSNALGVDFSEMLYVGDNPIKDYAISTELPITTIEIVRAYKIHDNAEYLRGYVPPKINSLDEIKEFIDE